ncbi:MAG TPA: type II toxin-antitoxin system VapC family toxin [Sulfurimonas sp.]|nr:type II toxin-antitoxin system VapC family toxin [Sulfurimonas sp.]
MHILVDTHIFLWLMYSPTKIDKKHLEILSDTKNFLYLSSISLAEIMIKKSIGKLDVEFDLDYVLDMFDMKILDFDAASALNLAILPMYHRDPFDRMIISQAISNRYKVITNDKKFLKYNCDLL